MKNKRRIIGILASMLLAIVGTVALVGFVQNAKDDAVSKEALVDVYVVDTLVPKGAEPSTIKSSVSLEKVPARLRQPTAITDLAAVGTNVAATDLQPGDQLLAARLSPKEAVVEAITDKVQVSARLSVERAVGGTLKSGDLVGVHLSFDPFDLEPTAATDPAADPATTVPPAKQTPTMSRLEFQHVLVTDVRTTNAPVTTDGGESTGVEQVSGLEYVVTLALSPEQAERFVFANEFGHIWLSNDPATVNDDGTRPVTVTNVYAAAVK